MSPLRIFNNFHDIKWGLNFLLSRLLLLLLTLRHFNWRSSLKRFVRRSSWYQSKVSSFTCRELRCRNWSHFSSLRSRRFLLQRRFHWRRLISPLRNLLSSWPILLDFLLFHEFLLLEENNLLENVGIYVFALKNLSKLFFGKIFDIELTHCRLGCFLLLPNTFWSLFLAWSLNLFRLNLRNLLFFFFSHRLLVLLKLLKKHKDDLLNLVLGHRLEINNYSISFVINYFFALQFFHLLFQLYPNVFRNIIKVDILHFFFSFLSFFFLFTFLLFFLLNNIEHLLSIHINFLQVISGSLFLLVLILFFLVFFIFFVLHLLLLSIFNNHFITLDLVSLLLFLDLSEELFDLSLIETLLTRVLFSFHLEEFIELLLVFFI